MKGKMMKGNRSGEVMKVSGNPNVFAEAMERKKGGKVMKKGKMLGMAEGAKAKHRFDRPGRMAGGHVGADKNPFSSAKATTSPNKAPRSKSSC